VLTVVHALHSAHKEGGSWFSPCQVLPRQSNSDDVTNERRIFVVFSTECHKKFGKSFGPKINRVSEYIRILHNGERHFIQGTYGSETQELAIGWA